MKVKPYTKVADIYNWLMKSVDYQSWSNYILELANIYTDSNAKVIELASGTCNIAHHFSKKYKNFFATDISLQMLKTCESKNINKICCDMSQLPFKPKFNFIFSTFDSLNYLLRKSYLTNLFKEVYCLLDTGGIFTFDVSLESNSLDYVKSKVINGNFNGYEIEIISRYNKNSRIHFNYFYISSASGQKFKEVHKQKIYDINVFFKLSEKSGFRTEACFDCFTDSDVNDNSKRAQFVIRKI